MEEKAIYSTAKPTTVAGAAALGEKGVNERSNFDRQACPKSLGWRFGKTRGEEIVGGILASLSWLNEKTKLWQRLVFR